ncbi:hypothetical protein L207DRAFT_577375 [Hyaloscypha variabilis F]|uniref:DASH complex subunit DAD4 n=1 Tax=Hyaloscypha variabilis (strain UAMH 11265 / GT02V1 / F) TaxID=1149755 RepID=A0A2J6S6Y1_HYAVF|nr:hypothetical protein L207DRAFT_577375 [Hyaloscypha variabilis F]
MYCDGSCLWTAPGKRSLNWGGQAITWAAFCRFLAAFVDVSTRRGSRLDIKIIKQKTCPHEHQQNLLLSRIITNVEKLNEAIMLLNKSLQEINIQNMNVELVAQMFKNYQSNVLFHLEATDSLKEPS